MLTSWSDQKFRETFRMNRACFHELCGILAPQLQGGHSNFKESLSVARKVAISLYRLSGEVIPYRINGETFAVGTSTACKVFKQFILAVIEVGTGRMGAHRMF